MARFLQLFAQIRNRYLPHRRAGGLFSLLFDPGVPVLFLLGAILLAVAGNAAYGLLVLWWGEGPWAMLGALLGSLALLGMVVAGLYAVLKMYRPSPVSLGPEEKAEPRRGLILFLSPGEGKADEVALEFHRTGLTHLWLVYTSETEEKFLRLRQQCWQEKKSVGEVKMEQPRDAGEAYRRIRSALREAAEAGLGVNDLYVDITACLRPAAIGASLAALESGYEVEYVLAQYDPSGRAIPETAQVMRLRVQPGQPSPGASR